MCFESTEAADRTSKRALIVRYNRAAISLKTSDWAEFNYCETVAISRTFFFCS